MYLFKGTLKDQSNGNEKTEVPLINIILAGKKSEKGANPES
jgi:hypothetical protein